MSVLVLLSCLLLNAVVLKAQTHGDLRLKQGNMTDTSFTAGRVEVFLNGLWGTICEDRFDTIDANVVCHQLGFAGSMLEPNAGFHLPFGKGSEEDGPIWLDEVGCADLRGLHVLSCPSLGVGTHNCDHFSDVAVICNPNPIPQGIRLHGGSYRSQGRLEVNCGGDWVHVCGREETIAADRVCQELGYTEAGYYEWRNTNETNSVPVSDFVNCLGSDTFESCLCSATSADSCNRELFLQCEHSIPYGSVQLAQSQNNTDGILEIFVNGEYIGLCIEFFTESDATAACERLGYLRADTFASSTELGYEQFDRQLLTKPADCDLGLDPLFTCLARGLSCTDNTPVAVVCTDRPPTTEPPTTIRDDSLPFSVETLAAICMAGAALVCFCCLFAVVCCTHLFCDYYVTNKRRDRPLLDNHQNAFTFTDIDSKLDNEYTLEMKTITQTANRPTPHLVPCATPQIPSRTSTLDRKGCNSPYPFPEEVERIELRCSQENLLKDNTSLPSNLQQLADQLQPPEAMHGLEPAEVWESQNLETISEKDSEQSEEESQQLSVGFDTT